MAKKKDNKVKTTNKEKKAKKKTIKKNKTKNDWVLILVPVVIILVIIGGIFAVKYFFKPEPTYQAIEYNGFTFVNVSNIWITHMEFNGRDYQLMFKYPPNEVEDIPITYKLNWFTKLTSERKQIYITFDPEDDNLGYIALVATDLSRALSRVYNLQPIAACTKNITEACSDRPIKTCDNTSMPVIYLNDDPNTSIIYSENCLTISGEKENIVKATEKVILNWYKIIPDEN
jgi:hypothetical protein